MEMLNEMWASVCGYHGRYEVSNLGRMKSLARFRRGKSGSEVPMPEKIMSPTPKKQSSNGRTRPYMEVKLRDGSPREVRCKSFLVHRLVAQAFIGELFEGAQVDHVDGSHDNNRASNLRILSAQEHGRKHPNMADSSARKAMQSAAQEKLRHLRATGQIVGRHRVSILSATLTN